MKQFTAAILLVAGALLLFQFTVQGTARALKDAAPSGEDEISFNLPFTSLGQNYPDDALHLVGAFWCLVISFIMTLTGSAKKPAITPRSSDSPAARFAAGARPGGKVARLMLLNSLFLLSAIFVAYIGATRTNNEHTLTVAVFGGVALLQSGTGLLLLLMALIEKPKGLVSLILGMLLYFAGGALAVLLFIWGGA